MNSSFTYFLWYMKILVINAWSSSLKYQLFDMNTTTVLVKWNIEKIWVQWSAVMTHKDALQSVVVILTEWWNLDIDAIGHRVVHWWEYFKSSVVITSDVLAKITECSDLAPLHNPINIEWIRACEELFPNIQQIAVFDTAFHQTMEPAHYLYPLPMKYYETHKIRRYGFHWTSHQYIYEKLLADYDVVPKNLKVITCHIGNGASITAIKDWKVIETSMGMTPLEWLMMGTRSGNIDPAIIPYLMEHEAMDTQHINDLLNKQSWLLGVSWVSSDMREIFAAQEKWDKNCQLALNMYTNSLVKYIWSYVALLWGVDVIVLTAWIMEHRTQLRSELLKRLSYLGIVIDKEANENTDILEKKISAPESQVSVFVIPTNEELMIANQTFGLMNNE